MTIRIGTSGWVYAHWRGIFYPEGLPQRDWLGHYAREFDTVEINYTFYRLPGEATFDRWRKQAPPGFLYAVKASRFLTHLKKLKDPLEPLQKLFERASRLGETLGPVLYQLPPRWRANLPRFEHFLAALPPGYSQGARISHVVEFRDPSWLIEDVFRLMERYGVAHCIHDMHLLQVPQRVTAPPVYVRFHGDVAHGGDYQEADLETWARRIDCWRGQDLDVCLFQQRRRRLRSAEREGAEKAAGRVGARGVAAPRRRERSAFEGKTRTDVLFSHDRGHDGLYFVL